MPIMEARKNKKRKGKKGKTQTIQNEDSEHDFNAAITIENTTDERVDEEFFLESNQDDLNQCLVCKGELTEVYKPKSCFKSGTSLIDHISANICYPCQETMKEKCHSKMIHSKEILTQSTKFLESCTPCSCLACEKRLIETCTESENSMNNHIWLDLKCMFHHIYMSEGLTLQKDIESYLPKLTSVESDQFDFDHLKDIVHRLCLQNPRRLFQCLHNQAQIYVVEARLRLLNLIAQKKSSNILLAEILRGYTAFCSAAARTSFFINELDQAHLQKFNLTWDLVNRYLYYSLIFADAFIQAALPDIITHQKWNCLSTCNNESHTIIKLFEQEMQTILECWSRSRSVNKDTILQQDIENVCMCDRCNQVREEDQEFHKYSNALKKDKEWKELIQKVSCMNGEGCCLKHSNDCTTRNEFVSDPQLSFEFQMLPSEGTSLMHSPDHTAPSSPSFYDHCSSPIQFDPSSNISLEDILREEKLYPSLRENNVPNVNMESKNKLYLKQQLCLLASGDWSHNVPDHKYHHFSQNSTALSDDPTFAGWHQILDKSPTSSKASQSSCSSRSRLAQDLNMSEEECDGHQEGDDSNEETSSNPSCTSSQSNHRESRVCDCCYCEPPVEPKNKGYHEMRDKLRGKLQRKKDTTTKQKVPSKMPRLINLDTLDLRPIDDLLKYINGKEDKSENQTAKSSKKGKKKKKTTVESQDKPVEKIPEETFCSTENKVNHLKEKLKNGKDTEDARGSKVEPKKKTLKKITPPQLKSSKKKQSLNVKANSTENSKSELQPVLPTFLLGPDSAISITVVNNETNSELSDKESVDVSQGNSGPSYTSTTDGKNNIITVSLSSKESETVSPSLLGQKPITVFVNNGKDENGVSLKDLKVTPPGNKSKKKKKKSTDMSQLDEVFMPKENIDNDMDEEEKVIEEFKRFCLDSKPPAHKEKIRFNLNGSKKN